MVLRIKKDYCGVLHSFAGYLGALGGIGWYSGYRMVLGVQCGTRGCFGKILGTGATGSFRGVHGGTGKY